MTMQSSNSCLRQSQSNSLSDTSNPRVAREEERTCEKVKRSSDRKTKITRRKKEQLQEYKRLRQLIPSVSSVPSHLKVPKVTIINEAVKYIDELHSKVAERLSQGTLVPSHLMLPHNLLSSTNSPSFNAFEATSGPSTDQSIDSLDQMSLQDAFNCLLNRLSLPLAATTAPCTAPPA